MNGLTPRAREQLRRQFRPRQTRLLFIGEAPPASGRFFYSRNSGLYRAMRDVFQAVDPAITDDNFLLTFQSLGCYLLDLCPRPVDRLDLPARRAARLAAEPALARSIAARNPASIAVLLRSISGNVAQAAERAHWRGPILTLPYPGRWSHLRREFDKALTPAVHSLHDSGR